MSDLCGDSSSNDFHGWLNIYKPRGVSSAKIVSIVKKSFHGKKVGHAGTLDVEAKGVLPIAIGEATKLVQFLIEAKKTYIFTVKFGAQTDSADSSGKIINTTTHIPTKKKCIDICTKFIGQIRQRPNIFSAIKVNGQRSYKLARIGQAVDLPYRIISIYDLNLTHFDELAACATYTATCSKGTYIRTLAEDIALSLQSLGFVIELKRTKVGIFSEDNSIEIKALMTESQEAVLRAFVQNKIRIEAILDDISVIDATTLQAQQIKFGQKCFFDQTLNSNLVWVRYESLLLAIGSIKEHCFNSTRVFNLI